MVLAFLTFLEPAFRTCTATDHNPKAYGPSKSLAALQDGNGVLQGISFVGSEGMEKAMETAMRLRASLGNPYFATCC